MRGRDIAYVSQDASTALDPSMRVSVLVAEVMKVHETGGSTDDVRAALERVYLPNDHDFLRRFPHQLSGGQQQRLAIGIALACRPSVLVLDEPTTGLDVVTQAHILDEVRRICRDESVACVFVSHDLAAMAMVATRLAVLYAGRFVEEGPASDLLTAPRHPYSAGLVASVPTHTRPETPPGIAGVAVGLADRPPGCAFAPRCSQRTDACDMAMPPLDPIDSGHRVRCLHWEQTPVPERRGRTDVATSGDEAVLSVDDLRAEHGRGSALVVAANAVARGSIRRVGEPALVAVVDQEGFGSAPFDPDSRLVLVDLEVLSDAAIKAHEIGDGRLDAG